jgi:hypothetical protein
MRRKRRLVSSELNFANSNFRLGLITCVDMINVPPMRVEGMFPALQGGGSRCGDKADGFVLAESHSKSNTAQVERGCTHVRQSRRLSGASTVTDTWTIGPVCANINLIRSEP